MKTWDTSDAELLRASREARGLDRFQLARLATVAVTHITQLEEGGDSAFYSPALKLATGRRVLGKLGVDLPDGAAATDVPAPANDDPPIHSAAAKAEAPAVAATVAAALPPSASTVRPARAMVLGLGAAACVTVAGLIAWAGVFGPAGDAYRPWSTPGRTPLPMATDAARMPVALDVRPDVVAVTPTGPGEAAPSASMVAQHASDETKAACRWSSEPAKVIGPAGDKPDTYVHLRARDDVEVCVMDGLQRVTRVLLKAGEERSVFGSGPWQLSSEQLERVSVFYRGGRIRSAEPAAASHWLIVSANLPAHQASWAR